MNQFICFIIMITLLSGCSNSKRKGVDTEKQSPSQIVSPIEEGTVVISEQSETDTLKGSLKAKAMGTIGNTGIMINYYSPAVRGRIIWGGLIPFDGVWVTGAHRATSIDFNQEVEIGGVKIASGKYALFTIPGKEEWTIIINKNWDQHLTDDYNQTLDVVRLKVKPETEGTHQERLRYLIESEDGQRGEVLIYWEKLVISIPITSTNI